MNETLDSLRARFEGAGQGHVFAHIARLTPEQAGSFAAELEAIDLGLVAKLGAKLKGGAAAEATPSFAPPVVTRMGDAHEAEAIALGNGLLAEGKVGFVLVAGGQGSRLGFDGPKGAFEIGPVTSKSLFEWHAARILAAGTRHGFRPTWYIMTSRANDQQTRSFFEAHANFGFEREDLFFFSQDMLPALDGEGRIVLAGPGEVFLAPDGHGGTLAALHASGALAHMEQRGIEELSYFQVDNPLARPADPLFVGRHRAGGAEMSSKVVPKRDAAEKVGVLGLVDGVLGCIEYSDLSAELREAQTEEGDLVFNAGNIAAHMISRGFVERLNRGGALDLPWHIARKDLATINGAGEPTKLAGVKFETFVFDALGQARSCVTLEVDRALEFSPVKNAEGSDSPATCKADLSAIGRAIAGLGDGTVEIDPRAAETADEFRGRAHRLEHTDGGALCGPPQQR